MEKEKKFTVYKTTMIVLISIFITFMITTISLYTYFTKNPITVSVGSKNSNKSIANQLEQYREIIDKYYLGEVNEEKLEEGAIKGYIEGLGDPYTEYISKEDMDDYLDDTMGNYVGIGIYMIKNTDYDRIQVLSTIKGSPAEKVGIQAGDLIISVNGVEYKADDMTTASNNIKGEEGTKLTIEILRGTQNIKYEITREKVKVNQVEGKVLSNNIGYIQFSSFDETTAKDFKAKYEELAKKGIQSLIIDLRNNGGGLVDQALKIADYITEKDSVLLYEVDKNGKEEDFTSDEEHQIDIPMTVLVNQYSASASEIFAGAIQDYDLGAIVGTQTYGKGVVQVPFELKSGNGGLKVTISKYYTPSGENINKVGINPDYEVELNEDELKEEYTKEKDSQINKALEILNEELK